MQGPRSSFIPADMEYNSRNSHSMVLSDEEPQAESSEGDSEANNESPNLLHGISYFSPESILEGMFLCAVSLTSCLLANWKAQPQQKRVFEHQIRVVFRCFDSDLPLHYYADYRLAAADDRDLLRRSSTCLHGNADCAQ